MRPVASAYVLDKTDELPGLAQRFENRLVEKDDLYLEDFRSMQETLLAGPARHSQDWQRG